MALFRESTVEHVNELFPCITSAHESNDGMKMLSKCSMTNICSKPLMMLRLPGAAIGFRIESLKLLNKPRRKALIDDINGIFPNNSRASNRKRIERPIL